eukprot:s4755_g2.t1
MAACNIVLPACCWALVAGFAARPSAALRLLATCWSVRTPEALWVTMASILLMQEGCWHTYAQSVRCRVRTAASRGLPPGRLARTLVGTEAWRGTYGIQLALVTRLEKEREGVRGFVMTPASASAPESDYEMIPEEEEPRRVPWTHVAVAALV